MATPTAQVLRTAARQNPPGACAYALLTGRTIFAAPRPGDLMHQIRHERVTPPSDLNPDIPGRLDALVLKCLAKDPADRYQTA